MQSFRLHAFTFFFLDANKSKHCSLNYRREKSKKDCTEFGIAPAHLEDKMISAINFSRDRLNILLLKQTLMALKTYTCVKNQANQTALQYQSQAFIHSHKKFHVN